MSRVSGDGRQQFQFLAKSLQASMIRHPPMHWKSYVPSPVECGIHDTPFCLLQLQAVMKQLEELELQLKSEQRRRLQAEMEIAALHKKG